jgi:hypothetical protein
MSESDRSLAAGQRGPSYFVLSCMDYRHLDDIVRELATFCFSTSPGAEANGSTPSGKLQIDDYDHFILAGACLGVVQPTYSEWAKTFWNHLETAVLELHRTIHTVLLIEHQDCGAYKLFFRPNDIVSPLSNEDLLHQGMALLVEHAIRNHSHPKIKGLNVRRLIMRPVPGSLTDWKLEHLAPL